MKIIKFFKKKFLQRINYCILFIQNLFNQNKNKDKKLKYITQSLYDNVSDIPISMEHRTHKA